MRRIVLALLSLLVLAAPAAGQPKKMTVITQPTPKLQAAQPAKPPLILKRLAAPAPDPATCSQACSRTYYFCQSTGVDDCGGPWAQCRARCSANRARPSLLPGSAK